MSVCVERRVKILLNRIRSERKIIAQQKYKDYYEQFYSSKFDHKEERGNLLKKLPPAKKETKRNRKLEQTDYMA